eukprot:3455746-Pyramimonas_sp.AAC.1
MTMRPVRRMRAQPMSCKMCNAMDVVQRAARRPWNGARPPRGPGSMSGTQRDFADGAARAAARGGGREVPQTELAKRGSYLASLSRNGCRLLRAVPPAPA